MSMLQKFEKVCKIIEDNNEHIVNNCSNDDLLELYSFYKQATIGNCNIEEPGFFELKNKAKYNIWNNLKGMSKEEAMKKYILKAKSLLA
jgi:diazepam-binding inhibitor (GABA receptor modulator, acyl-CoA-binding protein)